MWKVMYEIRVVTKEDTHITHVEVNEDISYRQVLSRVKSRYSHEGVIDIQVINSYRYRKY